MRIASFSDSFYPELSGISDSTITLAKELAKRGHHVRFYAPAYTAKDYAKVGRMRNEELSLGPNISIKRFFSIPYPGATGQSRMAIPSPWGWYDAYRWKPDIIHSQLFFGVGCEALIAAKLLNIPLIGTNHTAITEFIRYSPVQAEWLKTASINYAVWYYGHCNFVTAPSESVFTEMEHYGFTTPHKVVSNPIHTEIFSPVSTAKKKALKKRWGLGEHTMFYAGRLAPEKNIEVLIKALALVRKKIKTAQLVIAGHGAHMINLQKLADELQEMHLEKAVVFLGSVKQEVLADLYRASEIFAIASTSETQSLTLMQGMASGIPVVGANARALPEYITPKNGFIFEPNNAGECAGKMIRLLENPRLRATLGKGGRSTAEKFSVTHIGDTWEAIYKKVISERTIKR